MGFPPSKTSGFPGNRVEPYLAGITTTTLAKLSSSQLLLARNNSSAGPVYQKQGEFSLADATTRLSHSRVVSIGPVQY
jgi:hypothetical protein